MIGESFYRKADLLAQSVRLKKRMKQRRWPDASFARCEQTIMLGFYSIRKLIESKKLTDGAVKRPIAITSYSATGVIPDLLNRHDIEQLYDLAKPARRDVTLPRLCNQFIHSYIFTLLLDEENKLSAVLVASDRQRYEALLEVPVTTIAAIFEAVGKDKVNRMKWEFDSAKGDYSINAE